MRHAQQSGHVPAEWMLHAQRRVVGAPRGWSREPRVATRRGLADCGRQTGQRVGRIEWEERLLRDSKDRIFLDVHPECFGEILTFLGDRRQRPDEPVGARSSLPNSRSLSQRAALAY